MESSLGREEQAFQVEEAAIAKILSLKEVMCSLENDEQFYSSQNTKQGVAEDEAGEVK